MRSLSSPPDNTCSPVSPKHTAVTYTGHGERGGERGGGEGEGEGEGEERGEKERERREGEREGGREKGRERGEEREERKGVTKIYIHRYTMHKLNTAICGNPWQPSQHTW